MNGRGLEIHNLKLFLGSLKKRNGGNKSNLCGNKCKGERRASNKNKNMNCFNYGKLDHFARDCTELKVMYDRTRYSNAYVSSCLMLAETVSYWTIYSVATDKRICDLY